MSKRKTQQILVPRGSIDADEDTIIEIPYALNDQPYVVAKKEESISVSKTRRIKIATRPSQSSNEESQTSVQQTTLRNVICEPSSCSLMLDGKLSCSKCLPRYSDYRDFKPSRTSSFEDVAPIHFDQLKKQFDETRLKLDETIALASSIAKKSEREPTYEQPKSCLSKKSLTMSEETISAPGKSIKDDLKDKREMVFKKADELRQTIELLIESLRCMVPERNLHIKMVTKGSKASRSDETTQTMKSAMSSSEQNLNVKQKNLVL